MTIINETTKKDYDYMTYKEKLAEGNENGEGDEEEDIILTQDARLFFLLI